MESHKVVSHDEWIAARKAYLAEEKAFSKARDELARKRRELPWEKVEKNYVFDTPSGKQSLADLFGDNEPAHHLSLHARPRLGGRLPELLADRRSFRRRRPFILPSAISPSPSCRAHRCRKSKSSRHAWAGNSNGCRHSAAISITTIRSRYRPRKKPTAECFTITRSSRNSRARSGRAPACFFKNPAGEVFHTYSTYGRGLDILIGAYNLIDLVPKGRDEVRPCLFHGLGPPPRPLRRRGGRYKSVIPATQIRLMLRLVRQPSTTT